MANKKADCSHTVAKPLVLCPVFFVGSCNSLMSWKAKPIKRVEWPEKKCQTERLTTMLHFKPDYQNKVRWPKSSEVTDNLASWLSTLAECNSSLMCQDSVNSCCVCIKMWLVEMFKAKAKGNRFYWCVIAYLKMFYCAAGYACFSQGAITTDFIWQQPQSGIFIRERYGNQWRSSNFFLNVLNAVDYQMEMIWNTCYMFILIIKV